MQQSLKEKILSAQISPTIDWGMDLLEVPNYWPLAKGKGICIAVLDTAIDAEHPNLKEAVAGAVSFIKEDNDQQLCTKHGTHCAGIIAGRRTNYGSVGIAPEASIYSVRVVNKQEFSPVEAFVSGIEWAIEKEVHIISISLACNKEHQAVQIAINQAIDAGIFVVAAVGNEGVACANIGFPAQYKGVVAVGAVDKCLQLAPYSSQGQSVDLVAPGQSILSTYPPNTFAIVDGTSTAAPFVVGLLALYLDICLKKLNVTHLRELHNKQVAYYKAIKNYLLSATIELGTLGKNKKYGRGLIDPEQLLDVSEIERIIKSV